MKQNEQFLKENHQLNYKVNQLEEDFVELKQIQDETVKELKYFRTT